MLMTIRQLPINGMFYGKDTLLAYPIEKEGDGLNPVALAVNTFRPIIRESKGLCFIAREIYNNTDDRILKRLL